MAEDNLRTETTKAVARLMSSAQITCFLISPELLDHSWKNYTY